MIKHLFYISLMILLSACSEDAPVRKAEVYEIKNIGVLSTSEYTVGKIIKLDDKAVEWYKYGDRKILINSKAKIKAGVNLSKIKKRDIKVRGTTIEITLPPAEITSFTMDPSLIRTEMESVTGFRDNFSQIEKNEFLRQGEKAIRKDIHETGILEDANTNAAIFVEDFYHQMGFENVTIKRSTQKDEK